MFLYIVLKLTGKHNIILGQLWRDAEQAYITPGAYELVIRRIGIVIRNLDNIKPELDEVNARTFANIIRVRKRRKL